MSELFFTSDTHFGHTNSIALCNRPFPSVEAMDESLIQRWNEDVGPKDIVYHLGDFKLSSSKVQTYLDRLNGKIVLIRGNHDYKLKRWELDRFHSVHDILELKEHKLFLCHYALRVWHKQHYGFRHLYGHSHGTLAPSGKSFDVGVDGHNFFVWHISEIETRFSEL